MLTKTSKDLTSQTALKLCELSIEKANELNIKINVSVTDSKGIELAFIRMDDSFIHSSQIAKDKAYTSASFGFDTDTWTQIFKSETHLEQGFSNQDRLIPFGGGLTIFENKEKVGAIGVSGGTEQEDIICAKYAIERLGLNNE
ncbi:GlcG/HbpS family heme-binding protein [Arcobacter roscoffensis]|uniref:Heme-binding protein n=1 Tax=Arcobacter roscoffensis TaxID=2961520 RepID=A0ABY5E701_9BACT|nr:heme-binding protein [Arcobacter roscoffensis]UTJ06813.1 heme-binding protein [Arcobacter roscoffensis]